MRVGFSKLGKMQPIEAGVYKVSFEGVKERVYQSGAWGFDAEFKVTKADDPQYNGRKLFETYPLLGGGKAESENSPSGALFRFVQAYEALTGQEMGDEAFYDEEKDEWTDADGEKMALSAVKQVFREFAQGMTDYEATVEVEVQEPLQEGQRPRNRIVKFV